MSTRQYKLYCEYCNWKIVTNGSDAAAKSLVEIIVSPVPGGSPKIDLETKKVIYPKSKKQRKRFKCPQCGRGVLPQIIGKENGDINEENNIA